MKCGPCRPLSLMVLVIMVMLIVSVCGCTIFNRNASTPTPHPTSTPRPTATPSPTPAPPVKAAIIGLWEGQYKSVNYTIECFEDGKLFYNEGGNMANGRWEKVDGKQYSLLIMSYSSVITLNDNMTQFVWGDRKIVFTKRT